MNRSIFVAGILLALLLTGAIFVPIASAQCPDGTSGNDNISCTGTDPDGVVAGNGDDTVTIETGATINNPTGDAVEGGPGDDILINNGTINVNGDGLQGNAGSNTIINNGTIVSTYEAMEQLNDSTDTGLFINNGTAHSLRGVGIYGDDAPETIINNGTVISDEEEGIHGFRGDDTIINNGTVTGGNGVAIDGHRGNDTVQILIGSEVNGLIDGGPDTDTLIFEVKGDQSVHNAFNNYITTNGITVASGSLSFNGKTYNWENFEQLDFLLTLIVKAVEAANNSGDAPVQAGPQAICEGAVKVFRLPNGDLQVYSGFDVLPTDGFFIGYVSLFDVAGGITVFQDPGTAAELGWTVEVTIQPDASLSLQVFDGAHNPVGNVCFIG